MDPIVSVVLGEAGAPPWGSLRYVLEREGFTVVGHVSDPSQLERILVSVDPTVIVLDADMGAMPVLAARKKAPDARIVVVWPWGVSPAIADGWVDPAHARRDLGDVVRRATRSLSLVAAEPEPAATAPVLSIVEGKSSSDLDAPRGSTRGASSRGSGLRRAGVMAALVAASLGVLVAGALGLTRPNHPAVSGHAPKHGSATSPTAARPAVHRSSQKADRGCSGRVSPAGGDHGAGKGATTARGQTTRVDGCPSQGAHATNTKGNLGRHVGPNPSVHTNGHRPDSPGRSADKGKHKSR